jgi:hypothetical protein
LGGPVGGLIGLMLLNSIGLQLTGGFRIQSKPSIMKRSATRQYGW